MPIRHLIVPGVVFQAVVIGGGYGTGREVIEYVTRHGGLYGTLACLVIACSFALVLSSAFAFAVRFRIADYRTFLRELLGPAWVLYEILLTALVIVVIAVVAAATGEIAKTGFGLSPNWGPSVMVVAVIVTVVFGRSLAVAAMSVWAVVIMFGLLTLTVVAVDYSSLNQLLEHGSGSAGEAIFSGVQFAVYNSALIPALIYCTTELRTVRAGIVAGIIAGLFGALPALALHLVLNPQMPHIEYSAIPVYAWLTQGAYSAGTVCYFVILMGTVVLTVIGVLQGVRDRIDGWRVEHGYPHLSGAWHGLIAATILGSALACSKFGIVALIAQGYGALSWAFFLVFTAPLLTLGLWKIRNFNEG